MSKIKDQWFRTNASVDRANTSLMHVGANRSEGKQEKKSSLFGWFGKTGGRE
jgi:hypothetical protein